MTVGLEKSDIGMHLYVAYLFVFNLGKENCYQTHCLLSMDIF